MGDFYRTPYIQRMAIPAPIQEKQSLKYKLSRAIKGKKSVEEETIPIKRPIFDKEPVYYVEFTKEQREKINAYFKAVDQLSKQDHYKDALGVAKAATAVYDILKDEVRHVNFHPQHINRIQTASEFQLIRDRVVQRQPLGLIDAASLLKIVATPKMDTKTQEQFSDLAQMLSTQKVGKQYDQAAAQFMRDKSVFIKAWQTDESMPGGGHSFTRDDAKRVLTDTMDRDMFLGMMKTLESASQMQDKSHGKKKDKKQEDDDRSRGGRSR